ncbi:MAG: hypothetical protein NVSMB5_07080 [Candidatus Velthaea sp.]
MVLRSLAAVALLTSILCAPAAAEDGVLRVSAPHALLPFLKSVAGGFGTSQAVRVDVSERSSNAAAAALKAGEVDIALSDSVPANESTINDTAIAAVAFALVANTSVGLEGLSSARVKALFDHTARSWKDAGGAEVPVTTIERPRRSATQMLLERVFALDPARRAADAVQDASSSVVADVRSTRGAIGVVGLPFAGDLSGVTVLKLDGVPAGTAGIAAKQYPFFAYEHALTLSGTSLSVSRFVAYLRTQSDAWRAAGFIPMRDVR